MAPVCSRFCRQLANDRGRHGMAPSGLGKLGLQLRDEALGAVENLAALGGFNGQRSLLTGLGAPPVPWVERETPKASHGRSAGLRGPMPCARRQRSERRRFASRRSVAVMISALSRARFLLRVLPI
jgi:hypothetical protein